MLFKVYNISYYADNAVLYDTGATIIGRSSSSNY